MDEVARAAALSATTAAVLVYVNDPSTIPDLVEWLTRRPDVIAARVGEHEIEVSLLGSRQAPWNQMELELRLRAWQAGRAGVKAEIRPT